MTPAVPTGDDDYPLILRPWAESDTPALRDAIDEDLYHLKPWLSWTLDEPATHERTQARLLDWIEQYRAGRAFRWAIVSRRLPARILGGVGLNHRVGPAAHDISYWVRSSVARQGIAAAAVSAIIVYAFAQPAVERLVVQCDVANDASAAFATALGFQPIGNALSACPDGSPRPVLQFDLTKSAFEAMHGQVLRRRARFVHIVTATG